MGCHLGSLAQRNKGLQAFGGGEYVELPRFC